MSGLQDVSLRIPAEWDAMWFRRFVSEVLAKADVRNANGIGITVTSDGNSVATLAAGSDVEIRSHNLDPLAHEQAFQTHRSEADPHTQYVIGNGPAASSVTDTDTVVVTQSGLDSIATIAQLKDAVFSDDWTDLVTEGTGINPPGAASDPARSTTTGLLEFSASSDNIIVGCWQMPHGWSGHVDATKAVVVPHLHLRHLTSTTAPNNVSRWRFEYDVAQPNSNFANAYGTFTTHATVSSTNPQNTAKASIVSFGNLDLTGYGASALIHFRITRLANTDAADTDTSLIALYSLDLHYQVRRIGTDTEIPA